MDYIYGCQNNVLHNVKRLFFFLLVSILSSATAAENPDALVTPNKLNVAPQFKSLAPVQIQGIQFVGKAVLGAKSNQSQDADVQTLRDRLVALSAELNQNDAPVPPSTGLVLQTSTSTVQNLSSTPASVDKKNNVLRTHIGNIEQARVRVNDSANRSQSTEHSARLGAMSATVAGLQLELNAALSAVDGDRATKMSALRNKLKIQNSNELLQQARLNETTSSSTDPSPQGGAAQPDVETPMLSTIVSHR